MSATTEYNRWYILPAVDVDTGAETETRPKYAHDEPDLDGYCGTLVGRDALAAYAGLLQQFDQQDRWYIARVYATGNSGYQALNQLSASYQDTRTLATNAAFVGDVLSQRLGLDRSAAEWEQSFRIGPRSASE